MTRAFDHFRMYELLFGISISVDLIKLDSLHWIANIIEEILWQIECPFIILVDPVERKGTNNAGIFFITEQRRCIIKQLESVRCLIFRHWQVCVFNTLDPWPYGIFMLASVNEGGEILLPFFHGKPLFGLVKTKRSLENDTIDRNGFLGGWPDQIHSALEVLSSRMIVRNKLRVDPCLLFHQISQIFQLQFLVRNVIPFRVFFIQFEIPGHYVEPIGIAGKKGRRTRKIKPQSCRTTSDIVSRLCQQFNDFLNQVSNDIVVVVSLCYRNSRDTWRSPRGALIPLTAMDL